MPTYGTSLALAALAVALSALFLAGRAARPSVVARRSNRRAVEVPVAAIVVLVAAASTAAALYSTQTSRATAEPATKPPVYWRITDIPHGADARREAPFRPATLPPVKTGKVVRLSITAENKTIEIAPGVTVNAWTFNNSVPAPVIHLRVGQKVILTFHNHGTTWHSFDSHGTEIPYQHANQDIGVGASKTFTWVARRPGAYLYHCFTFPGAAHIASGMYGAMIVDDP